MRFSERIGLSKPKVVLRAEEIPTSLKNKIWNAINAIYFSNVGGYNEYGEFNYNKNFKTIAIRLRHDFFKIPIDEMNRDPQRERIFLREYYFSVEYPEYYDFLEYICGCDISDGDTEFSESFKRRNYFEEMCNETFESEKCKFRFVNHLISDIISQEEIEEIEEAANNDESGVHINRAVELYSDKVNPDYRNSVKESISAVESAYRLFLGVPKKNIGDAIKAMEDEGVVLPNSLKKGFSSIYGWTSGEDGIRHPLIDKSRKVSESEARLMLVMCSAYVNYLRSRQSEIK